jgi:hypothetical protein
LVDYFPPVDDGVKPVALSASLGLFGVGWFGPEGRATRLESGSRLRVILSVVPLKPLRGTESIWVELRGGATPIKSEALTLSRGIAGLGSQITVGEPLRIEVTLALPQWMESGAPSQLQLAVGVTAAKRGSIDEATEVATLAVGSELPTYERAAPRFPSGLPVAEQSELASLQRRVATAVERQHLGVKWQQLEDDVALAKELRQLGDTLVTSAPRQAYLAYVWATQLDARQWEALTKPLLALREPIDDATAASELALLRDYYTALFTSPPTTVLELPAVSNAGSDAAVAPTSVPELTGVRWAQRLAAFYTSTHDLSKASYFARRAGEAQSGASEQWSWSQPFEDDDALDWTGDRKVFTIEHPDAMARKRWRGLSGGGYLTSRGKGDKGKGTLTSPVFALNGARLSFAFGGATSKSDAGVELLVDGVVVRSATSASKLVLLPVWWDVTPWFGKSAQLRVFDKSTRQAAFLDQVVLWN